MDLRDHWSDPKTILCSYSQFCLDGLFPLLLFYWSLPTPLPPLMLVRIMCIMCGESKIFLVLKHSSSYTPVGSAGLGAAPDTGSVSPYINRSETWSRITQFTYCSNFLLTFTIILLVNTGSRLSGREETRINELCEQPSLLNPMSHHCWSDPGTMYRIRETSSLGCVLVALDSSSGGVTACWSFVL